MCQILSNYYKVHQMVGRIKRIIGIVCNKQNPIVAWQNEQTEKVMKQ